VVQLKILSGKMAGREQVARHFPFQVGRASGAGLRLEDSGVWDQHLAIDLGSDAQFELQTQPGAATYLNGIPIEKSALRNGDVIQIGTAELLFGLSPTRQRSFLGRELFVWFGLAAISLGQIALIYWLLR
jgi:pSer/pThr/pTyr-binding forkhead associated (FHA) protein